MRGHRCSYRIKLTQRLGFVNYWFVEELGSHDQLNGKDSDFKVNSTNACSPPDLKPTDLSSGFKVKLTNIPKSPRKLAPKPHKKSLQDRKHSLKSNDESSKHVSPTYNYVLGSIPTVDKSETASVNGTNSSQLPSPGASIASIEASLSMPINMSSSQLLSSAIDMNNAMFSANLEAGNISATLPSAMATMPSLSPAMTSMLQANLINYMTSMTSLTIPVTNSAGMPSGMLNPFLVNVKQEPGNQDFQSPGLLALPGGMPFMPPQLQLSPQGSSSSQSRKSHSPSPSRSNTYSQGLGYRDRSPLVRDQNSNLQKSLDIEAKIKKEATYSLESFNRNTFTGSQGRTTERAKSRKSSFTMRVPQKNESNGMDLSKSSNLSEEQHENYPVKQNSIPLTDKIVNDLKDNSTISSQTMKRFQTLNHVIQSEVFQKAKNNLDRNSLCESKTNNVDTALNLSTRLPDHDQNTTETGPSLGLDTQKSYFKLAQAWKHGQQLDVPKGLTNGPCSPQSFTTDQKLTAGLRTSSAAHERMSEVDFAESCNITKNEKVNIFIVLFISLIYRK